MSTSHYGAIVDPLNAVFGDDVFQLWDTGGGCTALQATLKGDLTVMITDDPHTEHGREDQITGMPDRIDSGGDHLYGYCVGVYTDLGCELQAMRFCYTASELLDLVRSLIIAAVSFR